MCYCALVSVSVNGLGRAWLRVFVGSRADRREYGCVCVTSSRAYLWGIAACCSSLDVQWLRCIRRVVCAVRVLISCGYPLANPLGLVSVLAFFSALLFL